jgi:hypothetical protein
MITSDFFSGSNAENDTSMLITMDSSPIILDDHTPLTTKLVDRFHGVLV